MTTTNKACLSWPSAEFSSPIGLVYRKNGSANYKQELISSQLTGSTMSLHSSTRPLLQVPRSRTVYGSRAFSSAVLAIWNKLPSAVLEANSLPAFRRQLKMHLFTVAYTDS